MPQEKNLSPRTVIDLFAGCGGLSEGFEASPDFDVIGYVEWERAPCDTLKRRLEAKWHRRHPEQNVLRFDIQRASELINGWKGCAEYGDGEGLKSIVGSGQVNLVIGGPPCQAYSMAGRIRDENGMRLDYRNYLFESYLEVVRCFEPDIFIFENVTGMLSAAPGRVPIVDRITEAFSSAGYVISSDLKSTIIDMADYGIPQKRKRVIILGLRRSVFNPRAEDLLERFYGDWLPSQMPQRKTTVAEAIGHFPKFQPSRREASVHGRRLSHEPAASDIPNHAPRFHNKRDIGIFRELAKDVGRSSPRYASTDDLKRLYTERTGKSSSVHKYYVLRENEQSNTIPAHLYKDGLRHIHPDPQQARSLTVREAAALQSFPDDFEFLGSMGDQYKMIGNAVPPKFSHCLAAALRKLLS